MVRVLVIGYAPEAVDFVDPAVPPGLDEAQAKGAAIIVNFATSHAGADKTVAAIVSAGGKTKALHGDLFKEAHIARIYDEIEKTFGALDVLVNNAGVYAHGSHRASDGRGLLTATRSCCAQPPYINQGGSSLVWADRWCDHKHRLGRRQNVAPIQFDFLGNKRRGRI